MFPLNLTIRTTETDARFAFYFEGLRGSAVCVTACVVSRLTVSSNRSGEPTPVRPRRGGGPHGSFRRGAQILSFPPPTVRAFGFN